MSTLKLSERRVSTDILFHFEKHPRYELGNTAIDVDL